jgi:predicted CopG family antitoxin
MTNITLSIEDSVYQKMKKYSEIVWSEFVRKMIKKRIEQLDKLENDYGEENILTMLASERMLEKEWNNEMDERWNNV